MLVARESIYGGTLNRLRLCDKLGQIFHGLPNREACAVQISSLWWVGRWVGIPRAPTRLETVLSISIHQPLITLPLDHGLALFKKHGARGNAATRQEVDSPQNIQFSIFAETAEGGRKSDSNEKSILLGIGCPEAHLDGGR